MRVAITGGTGFIGTHTARALAEAGDDVIVVARGTKRRPRRAGVSFVAADLTDSPALVDTFKGCDAVVHLVAIIRQRGRQTYARVNVEVAERVAEAAREAGVPHLVHQSALGADPDPRYPYLRSKWLGEQAARGSGVPYTVFRPSVIFGPGDGFFTVLAKLVKFNPVIPVAGDGQALFQPLFVNDIVQCIALALERGPDHRVHEVGGPEHLTFDDIVLTIKRGLGLHRFLAHVPVRMMLPLAFVMEHVLPNPPVTVDQLHMLEKNNITRLDSVRRQFGFEPQRFADNADYLQDY